MPPRNLAIRAIAEALLGSPVYWTMTDTVRSDTREPVLDWEDRWQLATEVWGRAARSMDWTRVLFHASVRCVTEDHAHLRGDDVLDGDVEGVLCDDSVRWALLTDDATST